MGDLHPCPFCGGIDVTIAFDSEQGRKWGYAGCDTCAARGPEVRTGYDTADDAPWRAEAIAAWNRRAIPATDARAEALREAAEMIDKRHRGDLPDHIKSEDGNAIRAMIKETKT